MIERPTAKCEDHIHRSDAACCRESTTAASPRQWWPLRLAENHETCWKYGPTPGWHWDGRPSQL